MSDKGIEAVSDAAQTEVTTNIGEALNADGLASQLEMLLDDKKDTAPSSDEEKAESELPPDEGESSDLPEDEVTAEEEALFESATAYMGPVYAGRIFVEFTEGSTPT